MRTVMFVLALLVSFDGIAQDFKFAKQTYRFVGGMFDSVTDAM